PGGCLVYASCSILPSEGEERIHHFLASEKGKDWTIEDSRRWCPAKDGFDGFYGARLRKNV
ncbi:MAG: RNA methyltransferase, partial [Ignavibacteria bacterium]